MKTLKEIHDEVGGFPFKAMQTTKEPLKVYGGQIFTLVSVMGNAYGLTSYNTSYPNMSFDGNSSIWELVVDNHKMTGLAQFIENPIIYKEASLIKNDNCSCPPRHNLFAFGHVKECGYKRNV